MNLALEDSESCAMCARFTRQGHADQAKQGLGWCVGYERYVHASNPPTVLFKPAPAGQAGERKAFLEKHIEGHVYRDAA